MKQITEYDQLAADDRLTSSRADAVARTLLSRSEDAVVVAMDEWLAEEKDLAGLERFEAIVAGVIERETDDAWLLSQGSTEDWIPKSCATAYQLGADASLSIPQAGLDSFGGETA